MVFDDVTLTSMGSTSIVDMMFFGPGVGSRNAAGWLAVDWVTAGSADFFIEEEYAASPLPDEDFPPSGPNDESSDTVSIADVFGNPVVQIGLLLVILLVVGALFRTRRHDWD